MNHFGGTWEGGWQLVAADKIGTFNRVPLFMTLIVSGALRAHRGRTVLIEYLKKVKAQ